MIDSYNSITLPGQMLITNNYLFDVCWGLTSLLYKNTTVLTFEEHYTHQPYTDTRWGVGYFVRWFSKGNVFTK